MSRFGRRHLPAALTALAILACSGDSKKQAETAEATVPSSRPVPACSLVTTAEVAQAAGQAVQTTVPEDTVFEPGYWSSTCEFRLAGQPGAAGIVTVQASGDYPPVVDAAELADAVSAEAMGISATPLDGFTLPAALYPDTGVVVQKGGVRLLVTGRRREVITALAGRAASRLP